MRFITYRVELVDVYGSAIWETSAFVRISSDRGEFDALTRAKEAFMSASLLVMWKAGVLTDRRVEIHGPFVSVETRQPSMEEMRERRFGMGWEWVHGQLKEIPLTTDIPSDTKQPVEFKPRVGPVSGSVEVQ